MPKKNLYILLLFIATRYLAAQEPIRFTTKEGLPTNHIYKIAQDSKGFIWLGTKKGVVKFDGKNFKIFNTQNGLSNNDVWDIFIDPQDRVWFGSKDKNAGFIKNDSIYNFKTNDNATFISEYFYYQNHLYRFSHNATYVFKNNGWNKLRDFKNDPTLKIIDSLKTTKDKLLCGFWNLQNNVNVITKNKLQLYNSDNKPIKENTISIDDKIWKNITQYYLYDHWIAIRKKGRSVNFIEIEKLIFKELKFNILQPNKTENIYRVILYNNQIQVTGKGFLSILDKNFNVVENYENKDLVDYHNGFLDKNGNLWFISLSKGIALIPSINRTSNYALLNQKASAINKIDDELFVGIDYQGIYTLDNQHQTKKMIDAPYLVYEIKEDQKTYVTSNKTGIKRGEKWEELVFKVKFKDQNESIVSGIKDIFLEESFGYVVNSIGFDFVENGYLKKRIRNGSLLKIEKANSKYYIAGGNGLWVLKDSALVRPKINKNKNIIESPVIELAHHKNQLMVGTDGRGIYTLEKRKINYLNATDGYSIEKILPVNDSIFWMATNKGAHKVWYNSTQSKIIDSYYESDGLLLNSLNSIYLDNNLLYATSDAGVSILDLEHPYYKTKPNVYFSEQTIEKRYNTNLNLNIPFSSLDFTNQENLTYQYRLLPNQEKWLDAHQNIINFNRLDPGNHTLEVKVSNQHGMESTQQLGIKIRPLWWQTNWAKFLFVITGLAFLLFIYFLLLNAQKKRLRKKEALKRRVSNLELMALRSQMNPHFVFNSLNTIQYYVQNGSVEQTEEYISNFAKLVRSFFNYSRVEFLNLEDEIDFLKKYLYIEKQRFEEKLNYAIFIDPILNLKTMQIPSLILQPLVENAVNHGIFHQQKGTLNIRVIDMDYKQTKTYKIEIEDDGIGIRKGKEIQRNSIRNYKSKSSDILKERLNLLKINHLWDIDFKITDRSEKDSNTNGTLVEIVLKDLKTRSR